MTSLSKLYFSDDFKPDRAKYYTLLIQVRNTDFSFAVVYQNTVLVWAKYYPLSELQNPADLKPYLDQDYLNVTIGLTPAVFTIVPKQLFSAEHLEDFARMLDVGSQERVYNQSLDNDNQVIFKDDNELLPLILKKYPYHKISFFYKGWLQVVASTTPTWQDVYLDVEHDVVHIAYFKNEKLRFYNSFKFSDPNELVYFTALALSELHLASTNVKLTISGDVAASDKHINALAEFFPKIEINKLQQIPQLPATIASQQLLAITALMLCA